MINTKNIPVGERALEKSWIFLFKKLGTGMSRSFM
jgi:hypothetical protein